MTKKANLTIIIDFIISDEQNADASSPCNMDKTHYKHYSHREDSERGESANQTHSHKHHEKHPRMCMYVLSGVGRSPIVHVRFYTYVSYPVTLSRTILHRFSVVSLMNE
jgi:hypothetical protein